MQIHARMEAIKQRLQSDPQFRQGFAKQVAKEMHNEQLLETQLAKQVCVFVRIFAETMKGFCLPYIANPKPKGTHSCANACSDTCTCTCTCMYVN